MSLPRYQPSETYQWNYQHAPACESFDEPLVPGQWDFCGLPVASPIGIAAGPLLNGSWCRYYAGLGFDVLTYKTVRSRCRFCYEMPNLQPVDCQVLDRQGTVLPAVSAMQDTWAVSFGMPSADPKVWRRDVELTRSQLPSGKILSVSVVGSVQADWSFAEIANDYATCARWAVESGADVVETNFSCPNVTTCDGQVYQVPKRAKQIAETVRQAIGETPYVVKIGYLPDEELVDELIDAIDGSVTAIAMTNSIAAKVQQNGQPMFVGHERGICGAAIRDASIDQVSRFARAIKRRGSSLKLIGVGGIRSASDVQAYLSAGAHACHLATAPMQSPRVGLEIREQLASER